MEKPEEKKNAADSSAKPSTLLDEWDVGADGFPIRKGDHVTEEDGELVYLHSDGRKTYFV